MFNVFVAALGAVVSAVLTYDGLTEPSAPDNAMLPIQLVFGIVGVIIMGFSALLAFKSRS